MTNLTDKKEEDLEEVVELTFLEFLKAIKDNIELLESRVGTLLSNVDDFNKLYQNAFWDDKNYNVKYFKQGGVLYYDKVEKPPIGYKLPK